MASLGKGDRKTGPNLKNEGAAANEKPSPAPAPAPTPTLVPTSAPVDSLSWGKVYQTVGAVPEEGMSYALPKADYRHACYVWSVPNYEVVIPGEPYYRLPINHSMLSAFGFLDTDTLDDVIAVADCSDWKAYVNGRASGKWLEMQPRILQQAVPVQSTAAAPAPTGWNWADCTSITGCFMIQPTANASGDAQTAIEYADDMGPNTPNSSGPSSDTINALCPALSLPSRPNGGAFYNGLAEWEISDPNQIQAFVAALGWTDNKAVLQKLYSFYKGNTDPFSADIRLEGNVLPSAMGTYKASNGTVLSSSNCALSFMLMRALNPSIAKFAQ